MPPPNEALVNESNVSRVRAAYGGGSITGDFLPSVYVVEPTSRCNVRCIMCPNHRLAPESLGDMTPENARRIAAAISSTAELVMFYFMGEPLLHPRFDELLGIMREAIPGKLVVSTNLTTMDEAAIDSLLKREVDVVICCIDRWEKQAYEQIRVGASFDDSVRNTERLLVRRGSSERPMVIVKGLSIRTTEREEKEFNSFWRARGGVPLVGWVNTWAGQFPALAKLSVHGAPYEQQKRLACADLWFKMVVNWQGNVPMCCHNWDYSVSLGNVLEQSVAQIWQSSQLQSLRASHLRGEFAVNPLCENCREWADIKELSAYLGLSEELIGLVF